MKIDKNNQYFQKIAQKNIKRASEDTYKPEIRSTNALRGGNNNQK